MPDIFSKSTVTPSVSIKKQVVFRPLKYRSPDAETNDTKQDSISLKYKKDSLGPPESGRQ